ncbi:MAG: prenyltransferase [Betaproteobacteria bacterium]|nr:prenyltransferase [Betaproteobacteria bacterium]
MTKKRMKMQMEKPPETRTKMALWICALRLFSLPASAMPILLAGAYVFSLQRQGLANPEWWLLPLIAVAGISYHLGANLISDFYDWKSGVDRPDTYGSSRLLVNGELPPPDFLRVGFALMGLGTVLGFVMIYFTSWTLLWFGLAGCLGGIFYTKFKYVALGELLIFTLFGLLMVAGAVFALTGDVPRDAWYLAIPLACLTTNILLANNTRDISHDRRVPIKTMPILFGIRTAKVEYAALLGTAYLAVALMVGTGILDSWALLVFLTAPMALRNIHYINRAEVSEPARIREGDVMAARLQMMFSIALIGGIIISAFRV